MSPGNRRDHPKQTPSSGAGNTPPNIVLITLDAINYGLLVNNLESLPHLKQLRDRSVSFENAFSIGASTFFSFPGIIAGVYPYHFGTGIHKNVKTIYSMLKDYGYHTAFINESNALLTPFFGFGKGIDYQEHFLNLSHADVDRELAEVFLKGEEKIPEKHLKKAFIILERFYHKFKGWGMGNFGKSLLSLYKFPKLCLTSGTESFQQRARLYHQFRDETLRFINEGFKRPQFLWIHTIINHLPYFPVTGRFSEKEVNYLNYRALSWLVNRKICERLKLLYVESLKRTDELVGDIVNALESNGLFDSTIIVVTADHGEEFMEEGYFGHEPESSSDRLLHVPLMFFWSNRLKPGSISAPVSTIDILATLSDLLDLETPDTNRGVSQIGSLWDGEQDNTHAQKAWRRPLFSEAWDTEGLLDRKPGHGSQRKIFTVRLGRYKLKVIQRWSGESTISEEVELRNWLDDKRLEFKSYNIIYEKLRHLLYSHIDEEGAFAAGVCISAEKQRIRKVLDRID